MQTYLLSLDCEGCGEEMTLRVGDVSAAMGEELTIHLDTAVSATTFRCEACGGMTSLGDLGEITFFEEADEE